ncbi:10757_t:CDS:2, partial [Entrophospora sp. SA101]
EYAVGTRYKEDAGETIEEIYTKLAPIEHVLKRPDTYVGSVEATTERQWIYNYQEDKLEHKEITYVPAFLRIFNEILVNAVDNKIRDPLMSTIKVKFDKESKLISVYNNGKGILIGIHKELNVYVPEMLFGQLMTSSDHSNGRNGLDDAVNAGTSLAQNCTLILTEGDSAKAFALSGLDVVSERNNWGVYPLRGKLLNVRNASPKKLSVNREVKALQQILGLQHNKEYCSVEDLRYGKLMIMTDQDLDGSVEALTEKQWAYNVNDDKLEYKDITYVPAFFKIFDEILVNAADNKIRDPSMNTIKVKFDKELKRISVYNNGKGIPIELHRVKCICTRNAVWTTYDIIKL